MKIRVRIALLAAATGLTIVATAPASAGIPVIDPSAIAQIRQTVSVATRQLSSLQQQVQQVTQMRNTIGQGGTGILGSMMSQSGLDFSPATGLLSSFSGLQSQSQQNLSQLGGLGISGESFKLPSITNFTTGSSAASQIFYYGGSGDMTQTTINQLRDRRQAAVRASAITSYAQSTATKADAAKTQTIATNLAAQVKASPDLRGDVQANTAVMMAVYAETAKQTALLAQGLETQASGVLASDQTGKR